MSSAKFLGIILSDKLSWDLYVDHICKKARKTIGFIHRSFHSAPINTRRTLHLALVRPILEYASTTWHPLNIKLTNRIESTQRFACRVILQQWKLSHDELLQESDLPTLAKRRDVATLCHLFKIFHGLCSSSNPYRPHPRPSLRHLNSCAVDPLFAVCLFQSHLFTHTVPPSGITCPKPLLSPRPSKPSNWPSTPTFSSQFCLCLFPAFLFCFFFCLFVFVLFCAFFSSCFWFFLLLLCCLFVCLFVYLFVVLATLQFIVSSILDSPGMSPNVIYK